VMLLRDYHIFPILPQSLSADLPISIIPRPQ
jgi:hypothetical protein